MGRLGCRIEPSLARPGPQLGLDLSDLSIQIAQQGYRTKEPQPMQHERSEVLEKIFAALRAEGLSKSAVAAQLAIPPEENNELTFDLMLNVLKGQGGDADSSRPTSAAHSRLVKG